jgi:uncharacterized membrane protein
MEVPISPRAETHEEINETYIYDLFRASIFLKGLISIVEILAGFAVLFITPAKIGGTIIRIATNELADEPGNFWAIHTLHLAQQFSLTTSAFLAIYLVSRGVIKLALVIALLKNKLWAYPAALMVLGLFIFYQIYQIVIKYSLFLILLTIFDIVVMWLIWHEYQVMRSRHAATIAQKT